MMKHARMHTSLAEEHGYTFVHPFDDLDVATGQGTIAMEIVQGTAHSWITFWFPSAEADWQQACPRWQKC